MIYYFLSFRYSKFFTFKMGEQAQRPLNNPLSVVVCFACGLAAVGRVEEGADAVRSEAF